MGINLMHLKYW
jgi:ATP citrate (pro-S)-lyase